MKWPYLGLLFILTSLLFLGPFPGSCSLIQSQVSTSLDIRSGLTVGGFSKLGEQSPPIKLRTFYLQMPAAGNFNKTSHGLNLDTVLSIHVIAIAQQGGRGVIHGQSDPLTNAFMYHWFCDSKNFNVMRNVEAKAKALDSAVVKASFVYTSEDWVQG